MTESLAGDHYPERHLMNQNIQILLIDDQPEISDMISEILSPAGYRITSITQSPDIVEVVKELNPNLVIVDYILEGINGGEYCSQIKKHPETHHVPVMILSGFPKVLASLGDYGADMIVQKPFDVEDLCQRVSHLVNKRMNGIVERYEGSVDLHSNECDS